jgi:glycosyltransferase involved in cell wall biosynthesis
MKYSVIIPCYDAPESYFRRCLDSIKGQTLSPYEVICVDDCSPVDTPKICEEYGFKYVRNEENLHNGGARNRGVKEATGDYVVFVNSDDYLVPEALEEIDRVNEGQDLILIGFHAFGAYEFTGIPTEENTPFISKEQWNGEPLHVCRRDFFIENELWEKEHIVYADVEWAPRVESKAKSYTYVSLPLYQFETGMPFTLTQKLFRGEV